MNDNGRSVRVRSPEPSVNNEALLRVGNGVLFLAARRLRYKLMAVPRDKRKSSPTIPPMAPANVSTFLCGLACSWLEVGGVNDRPHEYNEQAEGENPKGGREVFSC